MDVDQYKDMFVAEAREYINSIGNNIICFEKSKGSKDMLDDMFRSAHSLKGMSATMGFTQMSGLTHGLEDAFDALRKLNIKVSKDNTSILLEVINVLEDMIDCYQNDEDIKHNVESIQDKLKEAFTLENSDDNDSRYENNEQAPPSSDSLPQNKQYSAQVSNVVKVDVEKLDELVNLVGELVINRTSIVQALSDTISENRTLVEQLDMITTNLQNSVMTLRMVPIKEVFDRFPRIVRDLAQQHNKEINLIMKGEDSELDRSIVNRIGDPLIHLIRNAIDHGIESDEERIKKGKPRQGTITLSSYHEGGYVVITISDDGNGINSKDVLNTAIEKGLVSKEESERINEKEILEYIFTPGFSTSKTVTDISGRGVGMDAVKKAVNDMKGIISIDTKEDRGTQFTIKLPLTLAIIDAMLVEVRGETYAIPAETIQENIVVQPSMMRKLNNGYVISTRGKIIPLVFLSNLLFDEDVCVNGKNQSYPVVLIDINGSKTGIVVDKLLGRQEIVTKSLGNMANDTWGIAGATILGDGTVALILDINDFIKAS